MRLLSYLDLNEYWIGWEGRRGEERKRRKEGKGLGIEEYRREEEEYSIICII